MFLKNQHTVFWKRCLTYMLMVGLMFSLLTPDFADAKRRKRRKKKKKNNSSFVNQGETKKKKKKKKKSLFNVEAEFDFEVLFYSGSQQEFEKNGSDGSTPLVSLDYQVQPIILTGFKGDISLNLFGLEKVLGTRFEYQGDWMSQSGGSVNDDGDATKTIAQGNENLTRILSFIVDTYGLETRYRNAHFDFGSYDVVSNLNGQRVAQGSFELDFVQAEMFYNFAWRMLNDPKKTDKEIQVARNWKRLTAGVRYMKYSIPRMVKPNPQDGGLPVGSIQMITQQSYMFGGELSFVDRNPQNRFGFGVGTGFYFGGGPVLYYDKSGNKKEDFMYMADVPLEVTLRVNLLPKGSPMILNLDACYYVQYITYSISNATGGASDTLEGSDFFHGPRAKLVFSY